MIGKKSIFGSLALSAALLSVALLLFCSDAWSAKKSSKYEFQKGMCYVSWTAEKYASLSSDQSLKEVAALGTKWVSVHVTWYQEKCNTTAIYPTPSTPSDASIIHAIQTAHSLGMKVMLKPHLDLIDSSEGSWRGDIACSTEPEWKTWFENYGNFVLHYAKMAQENNAEIFCIGTELTSIATVKENMWRDAIIKPVREVYKGPLTYAANWNDEYTHVKFWDALDYVGIDAYFPLVEDKPRPTFEEIKKGWEPVVKDIETFQKTVNKPIIFPEAGYCSAEWTAKTPWEYMASGKVDLALQADCYRALLETFWDKSWFYGVYWWRWGTDTRFGGPNNRGFSPQNKPAKDIVKEWYKKSTPKKKAY